MALFFLLLWTAALGKLLATFLPEYQTQNHNTSKRLCKVYHGFENQIFFQYFDSLDISKHKKIIEIYQIRGK